VFSAELYTELSLTDVSWSKDAAQGALLAFSGSLAMYGPPHMLRLNVLTNSKMLFTSEPASRGLS
jgi:hypothetical protein